MAPLPCSRAGRQLTSTGLEQHISGAILYEETLGQKAADGTPFVELLQKKGIQIGIKVDLGPRPIMGTKNETFTQV